MRRKYLLLFAAVAPLVSLAGPSVTGGCGCGGSEAADAAVDAITDHTKDVARLDADVDAGPCGREGYVLDDAYDTRCGFCFASAPQYLPPPIQWEPCSANALPAGVTCRQIRKTWPVSSWAAGQYFEGATKAYVGPQQNVVLAFAMASGSLFQSIVAEADGSVLSTLIELHPDICNTVTHDAHDGHYALRVYDAEANNWQSGGGTSPFGGGAIGGEVSNIRPKVYTHYHKGDVYSRHYYASDFGLLEQTSLAGNFTMLIRLLDNSTPVCSLNA